MDRRQALAALALALAAPGRAAERVARVGFIANTVSMEDLIEKRGAIPAARIIAEGLRDLGWVEGRNLQFIYRTADRDFSRLPAIAREIVALHPDVIVAFGPGVSAAREATDTIPIVMVVASSVVEGGLVKSLARPGGNVTGMTLDVAATMNGKRLSLLKQALPQLSRVAFAGQLRDGEPTPGFRTETLEAARALNLSVVVARYRTTATIGDAFEDAARQGAQAMILPEHPDLHWPHFQKAIHPHAERHRMAALHNALSAAETGGLMAFGADIEENYRRAPYFIDRILRGAKPADIPIEQPSKFEFYVNLSAARAIGLTMPPALLAQATRIIQ